MYCKYFSGSIKIQAENLELKTEKILKKVANIVNSS